MRVLLVEDSERLQRSVGTGLRKAGYAVDIAGDGEEGLWYATGNDYDVIVLDLMLPRLDGLSLLRRLREAGKDTHVIILTARDTVEDRVLGLRSGSDDYLVKPFAFDELLARVQALARRAHGVKQPVLRVGELEIDLALRSARRNGASLDLPPREFALLEYLAMRRGQLCSRSDIEAHIYDQRAEPMSNVVDSAIYALRRKINPPGGPSLIQTRRGAGYVFGACPPRGEPACGEPVEPVEPVDRLMGAIERQINTVSNECAVPIPSPGTPAFGSEAQARRGEGQGEGLFFPSPAKTPSPQPSPGVPGEGEERGRR